MTGGAAVRCEVVVVGLGSWGAQALWRLAERGVDAVGVERYELGHTFGAAHGVTRLFRVACLEHPGLAAVARRSAELWRTLGALDRTELLCTTGGVMIGPRESQVVAGTLAAAEAGGIDVEVLDAAGLAARYPAFAGLDDADIGVVDPLAGLTFPELGTAAAIRAARGLGARVLDGVRVVAVEGAAAPAGTGGHRRAAAAGATGATGGALRVVLAGGTELRCDRVIVCAGAWTRRLVDVPLQPRRVPLSWFGAASGAAGAAGHSPASTAGGASGAADATPAGAEPAASTAGSASDQSPTGAGGDLHLDRLPAFVRQLPDSHALWGHGGDDAAGFAVKIGLDDRGDVFGDADPEHLDRAIHPDRDTGLLSAEVARWFRGIDPRPLSTVPCMYTTSPDHLFLLGAVPGRPGVYLAAGDSGHGYKHATAVGDALAALARGDDPGLDLGFLDPARPSLR